MSSEDQVRSEQASLWNGRGGSAWVEAQELLDRLFRPFETLIADAVGAASATRVLDVGCGTGSTTLAVARLVGARGRSLGVDISGPMIALARERAEREGLPAAFVEADAQRHGFDPASFDMIVSRFGVMFFDDAVQAFRNLRQAVRDDGRLRFFAWRSAAENPFMTAAERAAAPLLPDLPARRQGAPGQFAFADPDRIRLVLESSGWREITIEPIDVPCTLSERELEYYFTRLGPVGLVLDQADDRTRARVIEAVRPAFDAFVQGAEVRFTAACWDVSARSTAN